MPQFLCQCVSTKLLNSLGSQRHFTRRGAAHVVKDDISGSLGEAKPSKRGVTGHGAHEVCIFYADTIYLFFIIVSLPNIF